MLFIGVHNAWDTAVWISADHPENDITPENPD